MSKINTRHLQLADGTALCMVYDCDEDSFSLCHLPEMLSKPEDFKCWINSAEGKKILQKYVERHKK